MAPRDEQAGPSLVLGRLGGSLQAFPPPNSERQPAGNVRLLFIVFSLTSCLYAAGAISTTFKLRAPHEAAQNGALLADLFIYSVFGLASLALALVSASIALKEPAQH